MEGVSNYIKLGLITVGIIIYLIIQNIKAAENKRKTQRNLERESKRGDNPYSGLRNLAFSMTLNQIGFPLASGNKVYGTIMEWGIGNETATLCAFLSGDASLYLSSGTVIIGGAGHDSVKNAAISFISNSEKYISEASRTATVQLPLPDHIKFYFLTESGKFVGSEQMEDIENGSSKWLSLFEEANLLIAEIRLVAERND